MGSLLIVGVRVTERIWGEQEIVVLWNQGGET